MGEGAITPPRSPTRLQVFLREAAEQERALEVADTAGNEMLRRAALMRWFDAELYHGPLADKFPGQPPVFEEFTQRSEIESAGNKRTYLVRDGARLQQIDKWRDSIAALREFSQGLVQFFEEQDSPLDVFTHRIFAEPEKAVKQFLDLYSAADQRFDLAECDTLLRILRNRGDLRGPLLTAALNGREQYFRSRSLFADDWLRTERFLERPEVTKQFKTFLGGTNKWILRLYAAGGGGKTAYLRWLIARYCLPELVPERDPGQPRIPVARVDMDFVHVPAAAAAPWLLLIPIAEQLNRQLPTTLFQTFLFQWRRYAPALQRPVSRDSAAPPPPVLDEGRKQEVIGTFAGSLQGASVLVVLDTFEEMLVHYSGAVPELIEQLRQVRKSCPGFRVIVSGRQDLFTWRDPLTAREAAPQDESLEKQTAALRIDPWGQQECWDYLTGIRKLNAAMVFKDFETPADGNPFKVSLFADLMDPGRPFTLADLRELRRVEVEYLILRVIERIPESQCPLRWLLRYAVVPRQLTRGFVDAVLAPQLQRAMTSPDLDRPDENLPKGAEIVRQRSPWSNCSAALDPAVDWPALLRYAGSANWITLEQGTPRLQPEVVSPMRYLLQQQAVFWDIHRAAADYFEGLARTAGYDWADMTCEAVYHQFQFAGSAADAYWDGKLKEKWAQDPKARRKLAELVISGDFLGEGHGPLPHAKTGAVIDPKTIAKAVLELAALDAREAVVSGTRNQLDRASAGLKKVEAIEGQNGFQLEDDGRRALVEASIAADTNWQQALKILDRALASPQVSVYRAPLRFLQGNILHKQGDSQGAVNAFRAAADATKAAAPALIPLWRIQGRLGSTAFERDDLAAAAVEYGKALSPEGLAGVPDNELRELVKTVVEIDRSSANWRQAAERLRSLEPAIGGRLGDVFTKLRGQLSLDQYAPEPIMLESGSYDSRLRGLALGMLGDLQNASRLIESYWTSSTKEGPAADATLARFEQIRLLLRDCRDCSRSRSLLSNLRDLGEYAFRGELLQVELEVRAGSWAPARERWQELQTAWSKQGPRRQAFALATALALEQEPRTEFDRLLRMLAQVEPAGARIALLKPFEMFEGKPPVTTGVSRLFQATLPAPAKTDPDFIPRALLLADALRFFGDRNSAAGMLKDALELAAPDQMCLRRRIIGGLFRLEAVLDDKDLLVYAARARDFGGRWPEFAAIARLELAEWWVKRKQFDLAASVLDRAPQPGSQYALRYRIALARVERANGNEQRAASLLFEAGQVAQQLGLPFSFELNQAQSPAAFFPPEHQLDLWTPRPDLMQLDFTPSGGGKMTGTYDMRLMPLFQAIGKSDWHAVSAELQDRAALGKKLAGLIPLTLETRVKEAAGVDLRIGLSASDQLSALPWEWARFDTFRYVYRGQLGVDPALSRLQWFAARLGELGVPLSSFGAISQSAIDAIEDAERKLGVLADGWNGLETRRRLNVKRGRGQVALIKMDLEAERFEKFGYGAFGISLEHLYQQRQILSHSFDPRFLKPDALLKIAQEWDVLHICLPVTEVNGLLQLSIASNDGLSLPPSFLSGLNRELHRPVVILDVPHPGQDQFWAQQLVWRNLFARLLFEHSPVEGVIAAGLSRQPQPYLDRLLDGILRRDSMGALVQGLNQTPDTAAVLYAFDPVTPL